MKISFWPIFFMLLTAFFSAVGQIFFKYGSTNVSTSMVSWFLNYYLIIGLLIHGIGFFFMITAFKYANLSILYPILATSYIWVTIFSVQIFREPFSKFQWFGIFLIIFGIAFIIKH
ncbi:MAG: EamA family transporter [Candidatus Dadabacteria bacterium]|nr:EamA family transporter [Candidatus Dadabacteria bacterium]NIQ16027.1 EamA family transporter [Candidatus Dadabacteria bacterium]